MRSSDLIKSFAACYDNHKGVVAVVSADIVARVIRERRKDKGLSQEVLSGLAGLDRTHYSKIERGQRTPSIDTLFKIAHALEMPPHQLIMDIERAVAPKKD